MTHTGGLVLSRRVGERLLIGDDIVVEVSEIRRNQVRLRVVAPVSTEIWREEARPPDPNR